MRINNALFMWGFCGCCSRRFLSLGSQEFELGDDPDDGGEFVEASSVAGGEYFPVLQVGDAVFDLGSDTGDGLVELFLPFSAGLVGGFLDRCEGRDCSKSVGGGLVRGFACRGVLVVGVAWVLW